MTLHSGGSRISPRRGRQLSGGGCQHTILPNFPKNCMKLKEFGPPGGWRPKFYYVDPSLLQPSSALIIHYQHLNLNLNEKKSLPIHILDLKILPLKTRNSKRQCRKLEIEERKMGLKEGLWFESDLGWSFLFVLALWTRLGNFLIRNFPPFWSQFRTVCKRCKSHRTGRCYN